MPAWPKFDLERAGAVIIFICVLLAFTTQSVLASEVQQKYAKPYFLLWMTHSGYFFIAPLHILVLKIRRTPLRPLARVVRDTVADQLYHPANISDEANNNDGSPPKKSYVPFDPRSGPFNYEYHDFPLGTFIKLIVMLTFFIGAPAMAWYSAVPLTSMTDVTAIYNSNAIFAYILSIYLLRSERWEAFKLVSVILACVGVFIIAYGDSKTISSDAPDGKQPGLGSRLLGNLLALFGAISYGFYEVWYKRYATCPAEILQRHSVMSRQDNVLHRRPSTLRPLPSRNASASSYAPVNANENDQDDDAEIHPSESGDIGSSSITSPHHEQQKQQVDSLRKSLQVDELERRSQDDNNNNTSNTNIRNYDENDNDLDDDELELLDEEQDVGERQASSPGLMLAHANLITALIGVCTFFILWIPIPFLHWFNIETFSLPPDGRTVLYIVIIVFSGVIFNAGFMILLSLWGPVVASVGNLCTLVLVALSDTVILHRGLSLSAILGSALILGAFAVLVLDVIRSPSKLEDGEDADKLLEEGSRPRRKSRRTSNQNNQDDDAPMSPLSTASAHNEPLFVAPPAASHSQLPSNSTNTGMTAATALGTIVNNGESKSDNSNGSLDLTSKSDPLHAESTNNNNNNPDNERQALLS